MFFLNQTKTKWEINHTGDKVSAQLQIIRVNCNLKQIYRTQFSAKFLWNLLTFQQPNNYHNVFTGYCKKINRGAWILDAPVITKTDKVCCTITVLHFDFPSKSFKILLTVCQKQTRKTILICCNMINHPLPYTLNPLTPCCLAPKVKMYTRRFSLHSPHLQKQKTSHNSWKLL